MTELEVENENIRQDFLKSLNNSPILNTYGKRNGRTKEDEKGNPLPYSELTKKKYERMSRSFFSYLATRQIKINNISPEIYIDYIESRGGHAQSWFLEFIPCFMSWLEKQDSAFVSILKARNEKDERILKWPIKTMSTTTVIIPELPTEVWNRIIAGANYRFPRPRLAIRLLGQGLRVREVAELKWESFHPQFMSDFFKDEMGAHGMKISNFVRKGGKRWLTLLEPPTLRELVNYYSYLKARFMAWDSDETFYKTISNYYIFSKYDPDKPNKAPTVQAIEYVVRKTVQAYAPGYEHIITPHMLRHYYAKNFLAKRPEFMMRVGYRLFGWTTPKTMINHYTKGGDTVIAEVAYNDLVNNLRAESITTG